jgi:hypothetical protein
MKDRLIGLAIGAALVVAAFAVYGFGGGAQNENIGRYQIHTAEHASYSNEKPVAKTYLVDTATGDTWYDSSGFWGAMKRPRTSAE